jgi:hypothetical protein
MSDAQQTPIPPKLAAAAESCARIAAEVGNLLRTLAPSDGGSEHFTAAKIEFLQGVRALIDARIQQLSVSQPKKGTAVDVE